MLLRSVVIALLIGIAVINPTRIAALSAGAPIITMTPASASATLAKLSVRIVSYNVLSSHLASPGHFTACKPEDLAFDKRLPRVLAKLEAEIKESADASRPAIFCLQEVSHSFAGPLHTFFANKRYAMITGLYGKTFNNYMGIALAYPLDVYETISAEEIRLSDYRNDGWPRDPKVESVGIGAKVSAAKRSFQKFANGSLRRGIQAITRPVRGLLRLPPPPKDPIDHWKMSENRHNQLLSVCLKERVEGGQTFCLSNYHMPCAFYAPMVMNIHADLAAKRCQDFAGRFPHILAGDFNLMPDSSHYKLLTTGEILRTDPTYPTPSKGMVWAPESAPMRSAYGVSSHGEPDFTNYAKIRDDEPFIGTLDYIFLSDEWEVDSVKKIPHRDESAGPFPTEEEPSDHLLISADLFLSGSK